MVRSTLQRSNIEQPRRTRRHREVVRRPIFHPTFENLEVRITPATRIWSGALNNLWTQAANWTGGVAPSSGDDLVFPSSASQHTAANNFANGTSFASITIADNSYDLIGNAINLTGGISTTYTTGTSLDEIDTTFGVGGAGISVSGGGELDFVGVLAGLGGMALSGGGTLKLTGINANTYAGTTTVNAGTLLLNKTGGLAVPGDLVIGDGIGSDLVKLLAADQIGNNATVTVNSSGTLNLNSNNETIGGLVLTGTSVATGTATLTLTGNLTTNFSATQATITGKLALAAGPHIFSIADPTPSIVPDLVLSVDISGAGSLTKTGTGLLKLSGNNMFTGATDITAGILSVSSANALGSTSAGTTVTSGATLELETGVTLAAEPITINGSGFGSVGAIWVPAGTSTLTGLVSLASGSSIGVTSGQLTVSGQITDGGSGFGVTKAGSGMLALSNANPYSGITNINAGVVQASNSGSLGTGAVVVASGAELDLSGGITPANSAFTVGGSGFSGNGAIRSTGANIFSGSITLSATSTIGVDAGSLSLSGAIGDGGSGFGLNKFGAGALTFTGASAHTYTGTTTVNAGTLNLSMTAGTNAFGGNLVIGNGSITAALVSQGNDNQIPNSSSVSLNGANAAYTLTGAAKEVVNGLTLDGGTVTIGSGNLDVGLAGITTLATHDAPATITSGSTGDIRSNLNVLRISVADTSASTDLTLNLKIGSATGLSKMGAGTLLLGGSTTNAYAGTTTVNQGALDLNKSGAAIAIPGDLVIGDVGNDTASVVDQQNTQVTNSANVTLNGSNSSYSPLSERIATLTFNDGGTVNSGATNLTVANSVGYNSTNASSALATIGGILDLNGNATLAFNIGSALGLPVELRVGATVQNGGFVLSGGGILALSGNNTYTGVTAVNAGGLYVESNNALGASSGGTAVASGAGVSFAGSGLNVAEPFRIAGTGLGGSSVLATTSGSATLSGAVTLTADSKIGAVVGTTLTVNGVIDDGASTYNLTVANGPTGRTVLGGANVFHGNVTVTAGYLQAASNNALGNSASSTSVTIQNKASLELSGGITIPAVKGLILQGNPVSGSAKVINVAGGNTYGGAAGAIALYADSTVAVAAGTVLNLASPIDDVASPFLFTMNGPGTLVASANNSMFNANVIVNGGTLLVNGGFPVSAGVLVNGGGTLGGSGTVTGVTVGSGGTVIPGNSPGILNSGSVSLATGSTFGVVINGATVGTQYNQLAVTGTVNLDSGSTGGATLSTTIGYAPLAGTVFNIINNDAVDPVTGIFNGLAEGATFIIGNQPLQISYVGGTGNDVTLTALTRIDTWTGLGGNSNWSTAANWAAGVAPVAGDRLVFPAGAAQTTNVNNLTAGTGFDSIVFAAAGYSVSGNAITLDNGLVSSATSGITTFSLNTTLNANQTFNIATGGSLAFSGTLSSGAVLLTKAGGGILSISSDNGVSFNGNTTISSGILSITTAAALGRSTTANVTVASGATLSFDLVSSPSTTTFASLTLAGSGMSGVGALVSNNPIVVLLATSGITLTAPATVSVSNGNGLDLGNSVISGAGFGFSKAGPGLLSLGGANTYTGTTTVSAGTLWLNSGAGNRVPGNLVIDGTSGSATVRLFQSNTIANTSAVTLNGTGSLLDLQSYNDTIGSLTFTGGSVTTGTGTLTLGGNVTSNAATNPATLSGRLDLGGAARLFNVAQGTVPASGPDLAVSAVISGTGAGMTKNGAGTLNLSGANTYDGGTTINAGVLAISNNNALGTINVSINGGELDLSGAITVPNAVRIASTATSIRSRSGANTLNGAINLFSNATVDVAASSTLSFGGVIGESALNRILTKTGAGTLQLSGTNTYNGGTNILAGQLQVFNSQATGTSGTVTVASGASLSQSSNTYTLPSGGLIIGDISGTATYMIATSMASTLNGSITLGGPTNFSIGTTGSLNVTGVVGGSSSLTLDNTSTGILFLSSTSTYTGATTVNGGTLRVDGDISSSSGVSLCGGTLTGNGTTPNVVATGGTVFPGNRPGILRSGSVNLGIGTTFFAALNGATAGTGYSQLVASGRVTLGGGPLQESLSGYTPGVGDKLTIIKNNSGLPVTGTFGGLAEGSTINVSGSSFSISYAGGASRQDVVLSYVVSTNTAVSSSKAAATYGDKLIFTALVTSSGGTPTGSVFFYSGPVGPSTLLGSGLLNNLGIAVYNIGTLSPTGSPYAITAVYQGATLFAGSTSTPFAQTVNKALLTVTGDPNTRQYGAANPTLTYTVNGFVNGETLATSDVTGSAFIGTTATPSSPVSGSPYQIMVGPGTLSSNDYNFSFTSGQLAVTPASLTVTANAQTRRYGDPNPTLTASYSGFKNGETRATSDVAGAPGLTTPATTASPVSGSPYTINAAAGTLTSGNYTFSYVNGQLSITKAALAITADPQSRIYGDANPTLTVSYSGFKNGETLATSDLTGASSLSTTAVPTSPVAGNPYVIIAAPGTRTSSNYSLSYVNGQLTITPATLTISADNQLNVYGNALPTLTATFSGFKNSETRATSDVTGSPGLTTSATSASHVSGNPYLITAATGSLASSNYTFALANGLLSVTPAALTIAADNRSKVYGSALPALTASYNGFANGDTAASLTTLPTLSSTATASSSVSGSPYPITASGAVDTDYSISYVGGQFTVTPASLTITANNAAKAYGAALPSLSASFSGFVNGDTSASLTTQPTLSSTGTAASHVAGSPYAVNASGAVDSNYNITYVAGRLSVTPVVLTITANNGSMLYGAGLPVLTASYSGYVNGDTAANLTTLPALTTTATSTSHVAGSPYAITAAGAVDPDYTISYAGGQLTVTPAALTITADNQSKVYGAALPTLTASYSGLVNGDTAASLTTPPTLGTTATRSSGVAGSPYAITASGSSDTDYVISYVGGRLTVASALLTITANNATKAYGASLPSLSASFSGFVNGDTSASLTTRPTVSTTATSASHVSGSPFAVTASGALDSNYSITYVAGGLSVTPVALTITANNAANIYGAALPALSASFSGFVNGDTSTSLTTLPTVSTTATSASHVSGSPYAVTASGAVDTDYTINYAGGNLTVTPASLTITANNAANIYGAALPALSASFSGFVNGDTSTSLTTLPTVSTTATSASHVAGNPYPITGSGTSDTDYTMNYVTGQLTVVPAPLTITANNASKVYGAPLPSLSSRFNGFVNGDSSSSLTIQPMVSTTATATSSVAGSPYSITSSGAVDSDYAMNYVAGQLTVGQAAATVALSTSSATTIYGQPVTFTANVAVNAPGSGTPTGTVTFRDGNLLLGTVPLTGNVATLQISSLAPADHGITATYNGDGSFSISPRGFLIQTIQKGTPVATLTQSTGVVTSGQPLTLTVSVTSTIPVPVNPLGIVNFYADQTLIGQAWVIGGQATITTTLTALQSTSHLIYGVYLGDQEFNAVASNQGNVIVNPVSTITATTTTLVVIPVNSSGKTIGSNQVATVTSISPGFEVPTGTVTYFINGNNWVVLPLVNGVASKFVLSANLIGKTFTLKYSGDATHAPSNSSSLAAFGQKAFSAASRPMMALARRGHVLSPGRGRQG